MTVTDHHRKPQPSDSQVTHLTLVRVAEHHPSALLSLPLRNDVVHDLDLGLLNTQDNIDAWRQLGDDTRAGLLLAPESRTRLTASYAASGKQRRAQLSTSMSFLAARSLTASGVSGARRSQTRRGSSRRMPSVARRALLQDRDRRERVVELRSREEGRS